MSEHEYLCVGVDVATDRVEFHVVGWAKDASVPWLVAGEPISYSLGNNVGGLISGPYARPGWVSRCIDASIGLWETFRIGRRARRRLRGWARGARRLAAARTA